MAMLSGSGLTWAQQAEPYSGPLHAQYKEGIRLLEDGHRAWKASDRRAKRFRRIATLLSVLTVVFAAAAGITGPSERYWPCGFHSRCILRRRVGRTKRVL